MDHQTSSHHDSDESSSSSSSGSQEERDIRSSRPFSHGISKDCETEHPKEDEDPFNNNKEDDKSDVLDNVNLPVQGAAAGINETATDNTVTSPPPSLNATQENAAKEKTDPPIPQEEEEEEKEQSIDLSAQAEGAESTTRTSFSSSSSEDEVKEVCEVCNSDGTLYRCTGCQKQFHDRCLRSTDPKLLCHKCAKREIEIEVESSTNSDADSDNGNSDNEDSPTDDSSGKDSDYATTPKRNSSKKNNTSNNKNVDNNFSPINNRTRSASARKSRGAIKDG